MYLHICCADPLPIAQFHSTSSATLIDTDRVGANVKIAVAIGRILYGADRMKVVTVERARQEGTTPDQLNSLADWHDERAEAVSKSLQKGKRRPGDPTEADRQRHLRTARELRNVAGQL